MRSSAPWARTQKTLTPMMTNFSPERLVFRLPILTNTGLDYIGPI